VLLEAERRVLEPALAEGRATCVLRLSGLYGPGRYGLVERVRDGRLALGPGDETWTNWCHRTDAVRAVVAALDTGRPGAMYHASDEQPLRRRDVVAWIAGRLCIEPPQLAATARLVPAGNRRGANRRIAAARTRAELGLALAFPSLFDGLSEVLDSPAAS